MKILFLTLKYPYAEVAGGHRIVYQRIRYLKESGHRVGLISFITDETPEKIDSLRPLLDELHLMPHPHRSIWTRIFHDYLMFFERPAVFWKVFSREMMEKTGEVVEKGRYDVVISEFSEMGQYLYKNPYLSAVHKIMSCHRCLTASYEKYQNMHEVYWRLYYKSLPQMRILRQYEFNMYRSADRVLVLTPHDRFTMQYYAQDLAVSIAPSGVDIDYLKNTPAFEKQQIILMTGYMMDPANEDGAKWFVNHVWPELKKNHPELKFFIVGSSPSKVVKKLAQTDSQIVVTGEVPDLRPFRSKAAIFVSPVRLGSGIRIKVLEAMASGLPVVSTSLGIEGIDAQTGLNCMVADTPKMFIQSIEWLLTDKDLSSRLAKNAQELVAKKYALEDGMRRFEKIIKSVVEV